MAMITCVTSVTFIPRWGVSVDIGRIPASLVPSPSPDGLVTRLDSSPHTVDIWCKYLKQAGDLNLMAGTGIGWLSHSPRFTCYKGEKSVS